LCNKSIFFNVHINNLSIIEIDKNLDTRYGHWKSEILKYLKYLRTWGEAGVVKLKNSNYTRLNNYGCIFNINNNEIHDN
jgi:hypothetical protein